MNKRILCLTFLCLLVLAQYVPSGLAHPPNPTDPTQLVIDTILEPFTVDPAYAYDTGSGEVIMNVYEPMIFHDTVWTDGPYTAGKPDVFKPMLTTNVGIMNGPAPYVKTFYFEVRGTGGETTFVATGATGAVNLFKDGQIYGGKLFVRDPDYGMVGKEVGSITSPTAIPSSDGTVNRANVSPKAYTGTPQPPGQTFWDAMKDTTWTQTADDNDIDYPNPEGHIIRDVTDVNYDGVLDGNDIVGFVEKSDKIRDPNTPGPWWNVLRYFKVLHVVSTSPYTITATEVPVRFHNGATLTTEDVEYSWERWLVQDRIAGAQWMLYYPLLGQYRASSPAEDPNFGSRINNAVGRNATHVWLYLTNDFPEVSLLQILSQYWASVLNKAWCIAKGDFDGDWTHGWQYIWNHWHDPAVSFIEDDMMGTGPYKFDYWAHGTAWSIVRFEGYWDGWPARVSSTCDHRIGGYVDRVTWNLLTSWTTRRSRFLVGDSDLTYVPWMYRDQVLGQSGIRCYFRDELKLAVDAFFFNFDIHTFSPYMGVPGGLPPGTFAENGIPPDIFSDINVRRGFAYAFDYPEWLHSAYLDEGEQPSDPVIEGLPYDNPNQEAYNRNENVARYHLRLAWGGIDNNPPGGRDPDLVTPGLLWNNGMTFTIVYPLGNTAMESAAFVLAMNINSLNLERFHVDCQEASWGSTFMPQMITGMLPLFLVGMQSDFLDPHDYVFCFMHSHGVFAQSQSYSNPTGDNLIEQGINTPGGPSRQQIYYDLQALYHDEVPSVPLVQPKIRVFERDWMRGWYNNALYHGNYIYHRWKALTHFGDANNDGAVNVLDGATIGAHWSKPSPDSLVGPLGYSPKADLTGGVGGTTGSGYGLVPGIPDGKVSTVDSAMVSAYWDGPPKGLLHP